jgi:predicted acetyltransferase
MIDIKLEAIGRAQESLLQNLFQLYTHDFSQHWAGTPKGDLDALGRFPDYPLEPYWTQPNRSAWLLRVTGHIAGFALLNDFAPSGRQVDTSIAEFFVVQKYRRGGVGTRFAHALLQMRKGIWEAGIARKNIAALNFWRSALASCPVTEELDELDIVSQDWNGPVLRFVIK